MSYTTTTTRASAPDHPSPASTGRGPVGGPRRGPRTTFARQAAIDAFGPKAVHHLNGAGVVDHEPLDDPEEDVDGRQAVARWLKLAAHTDGEAAQTAYQTADELRRVLGLSWADVLGRKAA